MKKLIAILVVFAIVAGAAFAQEGSWNIGGTGELGAILSFTPLSPADMDNDGSPDGTGPLISLFQYNRYGWYGDIAVVNLDYNRDGLNVGFDLNITDGINARVNYDGGLFGFTAEQQLSRLFNANFSSTGRIWGWYKLMDEKIYLEVAARAKDEGFWTVNQIVGDLFDLWTLTNRNEDDGITIDFRLIEGLSFGLQFPNVIPHSAFGNSPEGNVVKDWSNPANNGPEGFDGQNQGYGKGGMIGQMDGYGFNTFRTAVTDQMALGVMYQAGPLGASLNAKFNPVGVRGTVGTYAGVNYKINDQMSAGLNFRGVFGNKDDAYSMQLKDRFYATTIAGWADPENPTDAEKKVYDDGIGKYPLLKSYSDIAVALQFNFNAGALGAGVDAGIRFIPRGQYSGGDHKGLLAIRPKVSYNIIPSYLAASLGMGFYVDSGYYRTYSVDGTEFKEGTGRYKVNDDGTLSKDWIQYGAQVGWDTTVELWFHPLGTGASTNYYWPGGPAIIARYKLEGGQLNKNGNGLTNSGDATTDFGGHTSSPTWSAFDIAFRWQF